MAVSSGPRDHGSASRKDPGAAHPSWDAAPAAFGWRCGAGKRPVAAAAGTSGDHVDGPVTGPWKRIWLIRTAHSQCIAPHGRSFPESLIHS